MNLSDGYGQLILLMGAESSDMFYFIGRHDAKYLFAMISSYNEVYPMFLL